VWEEWYIDMRGKTGALTEPTGMKRTENGFGAFKGLFSRRETLEILFWSPSKDRFQEQQCDINSSGAPKRAAFKNMVVK
jgi:hypothetical protein